MNKFGIGFRREFATEFLEDNPLNVDFVELAPENWVNLGGYWGDIFDSLAEKYPVFLHGLSLSIGSAEEIFISASRIIFFDMIPFILKNHPVPYDQDGEIVIFKRRTPEQSNIQTANLKSLDELYDFIRMLDAEDYPNAFIKVGNLKILFSEVHRKFDRLVGRFEVVEDEKENFDSGCTS